MKSLCNKSLGKILSKIKKKENIVITICNPLGPDEHNSGGHGMALANIRERMELAFGPAASLITHQDDEQFFAILSLPYVENTDN